MIEPLRFQTKVIGVLMELPLTVAVKVGAAPAHMVKWSALKAIVGWARTWTGCDKDAELEQFKVSCEEVTTTEALIVPAVTMLAGTVMVCNVEAMLVPLIVHA